MRSTGVSRDTTTTWTWTGTTAFRPLPLLFVSIKTTNTQTNKTSGFSQRRTIPVLSYYESDCSSSSCMLSPSPFTLNKKNTADQKSGRIKIFSQKKKKKRQLWKQMFPWLWKFNRKQYKNSLQKLENMVCIKINYSTLPPWVQVLLLEYRCYLSHMIRSMVQPTDMLFPPCDLGGRGR